MKLIQTAGLVAALVCAACTSQAFTLNPTPSPVSKAQAGTQTATGYVSGVSDGDTFYIAIDGKPTRVRLAQVDAPEKGQPFGQRAEQALRELIWKRDVTVVWKEIDRYGRPIVQVHAAGANLNVNVNAEMVSRGFAWVYRQYAKDQELYALEREAQQGQRGLWADANPMAPWEWRKTHPKSSR